VEQWLVRHGLDKLVDVLEVCFLNFGDLLEIFNVKNKI